MRLLKKAGIVLCSALLSTMVLITTIMAINYFQTGYPHMSEFCLGGACAWFMSVIRYEGFGV